MLRLLIIDDEETILLAMRSFFTTVGFQVDCAREREEAEALLATARYAAVIADLRLTGINDVEGLDVVGFVRARCPGTLIVLLTAYGLPDVEAEARRRGVDAFLHKPQPLPELARILERLVERAA
jgi:two-component system response regulator QseB